MPTFERNIHVVLRLTEPDADHVDVRMEVQGEPLPTARFRKSDADEFSSLVAMALCFVRVEPATELAGGVDIELLVSHEVDDVFTMSLRVQGRDLGPETLARAELEELNWMIEKGVRLISARTPRCSPSAAPQ